MTVIGRGSAGRPGATDSLASFCHGHGSWAGRILAITTFAGLARGLLVTVTVTVIILTPGDDFSAAIIIIESEL